MDEIIVKSGRFKYAEKVSLKIKIVQRDFFPGTGDYEYESELQDDQAGTCFEILYEVAGEADRFSSGGYHWTEDEAVKHIANIIQVIEWD